MMTTKDEWVSAAMKDDSVVVELLVWLKQAQAAPPTVIPLSMRWGIRLPRSRMATAASARCDVVSRRKDGESSTRCSPTTPLSWSGDGGTASPSATVDGSEEISRHNKCSPKVATATTKKSRRKKTFDELKGEESSLLKERVYLKKQLATSHATFEEHRERNENLKRLKLDLNLYSTEKSNLPLNEGASKWVQRESFSLDHIPSTLCMRPKGEDPVDSSEDHKAVSNHDRFFALPDLNSMPSEEDSSMDTIYGTS